MHRRRENTSAHDLHAAKLPLHSDDDDINSQDAGPALPVPPPADDDGNGYPEAWYPEVEAYPEVEDLDDDEYIAEHRQHDDGGDEQEDQQQRDDQDEEEEPTIFQRPVSMLNEVRSVDMYEKLNRISEGTYGVVYRYRHFSDSSCLYSHKFTTSEYRTIINILCIYYFKSQSPR